MNPKYYNMSQHQLISISQNIGTYDEDLNDEWFKRYKMNFPYKLNIRNEIENCLMGKVIEDNQADKLILEQANNLRERRATDEH